jgi:hypothetical protein
MEHIEIKLAIGGEPSVSDSTKAMIETSFADVGQHRLREIWNGQIPPREKVSVEVQGCCVSIMDDWECTIVGKSYVECLVGLSLLHDFLNRHFDKPVSFRVLYPAGKEGTVDDMVRRERRKKRLIRIWSFIATAAVAGVVGYFIRKRLVLTAVIHYATNMPAVKNSL